MIELCWMWCADGVSTLIIIIITTNPLQVASVSFYRRSRSLWISGLMRWLTWMTSLSLQWALWTRCVTMQQLDWEFRIVRDSSSGLMHRYPSNVCHHYYYYKYHFSSIGFADQEYPRAHGSSWTQQWQHPNQEETQLGAVHLYSYWTEDYSQLDQRAGNTKSFLICVLSDAWSQTTVVCSIY